MAITMVKVKPSIRPTETYTESNFLRLHTYARPTECNNRYVTLEHLSFQTGGSASVSNGWRCHTIVDGEEMSKADALFIAQTYAKENGIPVIYECHSD